LISFEPNDEQKMLMDTAGKFARDRLRPIAREADETGHVPSELLNTAWQLGLVPGSIPEAYDGYGGARSALSGALFVEELAFGDLSLALAAMAPALVAFPVLTAGSEEQKQRYLPPFCQDDYPRATAALVEPVYQFDPGQLATTAARDGESYVLNGKKCYVPLAAEADLLLVYAHDAVAGSTQAFLLDKGVAGLSVGEREGNMGIKALPTYHLMLSDCRVPAAQRLGGDAGADCHRLLNYSRVALTAMAAGVARAAAEYARDYAKERKQFGEPIASRQAIAFMLADMAIEVDAIRLMAWEAAWKLDRGEDATREAYLAKLYADDMVLKVTDGAVQVLGGYGYIREFPVEMWLRNGRGFAAFDGLATV
jgi:alkylation response protein AidB-like acyl-CoA dehydrogenase